MYTNDVATVAQPGATSMNVSINFKKLKGHNMAAASTGVGKVLQIKAKQSQGTEIEQTGEASSVLWPDDEKKSPLWLLAVTQIDTL